MGSKVKEMEFREFAAYMLTRSLEYKVIAHLPSALISDEFKHLKYAFWAVKNEPAFNANINMLDQHIDHIVTRYGNFSTLACNAFKTEIAIDREILTQRTKDFNVAFNGLCRTLFDVLVKGNRRPLWLVQNMPNISPLVKGRVIEQTKQVVANMQAVVSEYEQVLHKTIDQSELVSAKGIARPKGDTEKALDYDACTLDLFMLGRGVPKAASALNLPPVPQA
ncbi:MAG: hypothetical protein WCD70_13305 [Alphaproteobacteria bacterium]